MGEKLLIPQQSEKENEKKKRITVYRKNDLLTSFCGMSHCSAALFQEFGNENSKKEAWAIA